MSGSLPNVVKTLANSADIDALDREGRTALFYAVRDGNLAIVNELINHDTDVNARDNKFETPLHFAARFFQVDIAELLLDKGAMVDPQDVYGNTPLFRAVFNSRGRGGLVALLLRYGAERAQKNEHGVSPESLAESISNYDVKGFFA